MNDKTYLDPGQTLHCARWTDINTIATLFKDVAEMQSDLRFVLTSEELANAWKKVSLLKKFYNIGCTGRLRRYTYIKEMLWQLSVQ